MHAIQWWSGEARGSVIVNVRLNHPGAMHSVRPDRGRPGWRRERSRGGIVMKVLFEIKGPIAYVTINRPERLNACDFEAYGMLAKIWREFRDDDRLRVAILTGTGERAFC